MSHQVPQCPCACSNKSGLICYICSTLIPVGCSKLFHEQFSLPGSLRGNRAARNLAPYRSWNDQFRQFREFRSTMEYAWIRWVRYSLRIRPAAEKRAKESGFHFGIFACSIPWYSMCSTLSIGVSRNKVLPLSIGAGGDWSLVELVQNRAESQWVSDTPQTPYPKRYWAKQTDSSLDKTMCQLHPAARYIQI